LKKSDLGNRGNKEGNIMLGAEKMEIKTKERLKGFTYSISKSTYL